MIVEFALKSSTSRCFLRRILQKARKVKGLESEGGAGKDDGTLNGKILECSCTEYAYVILIAHEYSVDRLNVCSGQLHYSWVPSRGKGAWTVQPSVDVNNHLRFYVCRVWPSVSKDWSSCEGKLAVFPLAFGSPFPLQCMQIYLMVTESSKTINFKKDTFKERFLIWELGPFLSIWKYKAKELSMLYLLSLSLSRRQNNVVVDQSGQPSCREGK